VLPSEPVTPTAEASDATTFRVAELPAVIETGLAVMLTAGPVLAVLGWPVAQAVISTERARVEMIAGRKRRLRLERGTFIKTISLFFSTTRIRLARGLQRPLSGKTFISSGATVAVFLAVPSDLSLEPLGQ
jgi:hypothetical protein